MDYKKLNPKSKIAQLYFFIEKMAFNFADIIISDTYMHGLLFKSLFNLNIIITIV